MQGTREQNADQATGKKRVRGTLFGTTFQTQRLGDWGQEWQRHLLQARPEQAGGPCDLTASQEEQRDRKPLQANSSPGCLQLFRDVPS